MQRLAPRSPVAWKTVAWQQIVCARNWDNRYGDRRFDSGMVDLTVFDSFFDRMPQTPFVYYADSAHAPYGVRDADEIYDLTTSAVSRLWEEGCDFVILACNTASASALRRTQENWLPKHKRVLGVFVPLIEALTERKWGDNSPPREVSVKNVALFATPTTIASRAFRVDVEAQSCGGVVDAIEEGDMLLAVALVRIHVSALLRKMPNPQSATLGCTYYPLLEEVFQSAFRCRGESIFSGHSCGRQTKRLSHKTP